MIQIIFTLLRRKLRSGEVKRLVIELISKRSRIVTLVVFCHPAPPARAHSGAECNRGENAGRPAYTSQVHTRKPRCSASLPFKLNSSINEAVSMGGVRITQ